MTQSPRHYGFAQLPRIVIRGEKYRDMSLIEVGLYAGLKDVCGDDGECFYALRNLADILHTSISTLSRYIPKLRDTWKLITAEKKCRGSGTNKHEIWHIRIVNIWQENDALYAPKDCFPEKQSTVESVSTGNKLLNGTSKIVSDRNNGASNPNFVSQGNNSVSDRNEDCFYLTDRRITSNKDNHKGDKESKSVANANATPSSFFECSLCHRVYSNHAFLATEGDIASCGHEKSVCFEVREDTFSTLQQLTGDENGQSILHNQRVPHQSDYNAGSRLDSSHVDNDAFSLQHRNQQTQQNITEHPFRVTTTQQQTTPATLAGKDGDTNNGNGDRDSAHHHNVVSHGSTGLDSHATARSDSGDTPFEGGSARIELQPQLSNGTVHSGPTTTLQHATVPDEIVAEAKGETDNEQRELMGNRFRNVLSDFNATFPSGSTSSSQNGSQPPERASTSADIDTYNGMKSTIMTQPEAEVRIAQEVQQEETTTAEQSANKGSGKGKGRSGKKKAVDLKKVTPLPKPERPAVEADWNAEKLLAWGDYFRGFCLPKSDRANSRYQRAEQSAIDLIQRGVQEKQFLAVIRYMRGVNLELEKDAKFCDEWWSTHTAADLWHVDAHFDDMLVKVKQSLKNRKQNAQTRAAVASTTITRQPENVIEVPPDWIEQQRIAAERGR